MKEKEKRYEYGEEGECRYGLASIESCRKCLFETLCHLQKNKERLGNDIHEANQTLEKDG